MKKTFISFALLLLLGTFLALCSFNITVSATGVQQSEHYVDVYLTSYFDPDNIIDTEIIVPYEDDMWFDEATNLLYTFGTSDWDVGVEIPTAQPGSPIEYDMWFDEAADTLYTYGTEWDSGVELPIADPGLTYGQTLSFAADVGTMEGYTFLYWEVNESINYLPVDHQFSLTETNVLQAVFSPAEMHVVTFVDSNSKILDIQYVEDDGTATAPESLPSKPGYTIAETNWNTSLTNITDDTIAVLQYTKTDTTSYTLSVPNGTGDGSYEYNTVATVVADAPTGEEFFHHWEVEDHTVSYQSTYKFTVLENTTITAVYSTSAVTDAPTVTITDSFSIRGGYKTFIGQFYVPSSYTMVEYGILISPNEEWVEIDTENATRYQGSKYNGTTGEYVMSFANDDAISTRAYLICKDSEDALVTVYSEPSYQILNGGFETSNLSGWTAYMIWKDESGMAAFQTDRVVSGTYFEGNYPYDRDGTYNLGVYRGSQTWDQSSERMGHLRSSNFVLGGSGWISFKLGGGKISSTAFVSVRRASDNVEVARFANKNYNNTTIASTQYESSITNAEAFMYQYYYDLSSVGELGEIYYIVLTESASYDWCIMSADSFITYYKEDLSPIADQTATNIVPSILGVDTASNTIVNGYFDDGLNNWQNVNSSFYLNSGQARSNPTGDGDLGVLRSSAFTVTTNQYIRFDWAGGLKYDKQIYISVKEVGTNIEVLRFVRRDNLSGKESEGFDNHMLNLSSLDTTKKYYLEICDNRSGGWGISYVDAIRLVPESEWNSVTSGDRAVSITPLETDFIYVKP